MTEDKMRLDLLVYNKGLVSSRERAREYITSGKIYVNGIMEKKCGKKVCSNSNVEIRGEVLPYVSRGGLKLHKALKSFKINLKDKVCLDIGASTGGFTHCMLTFEAKKVFAIDVGRDQLVSQLREDNRVISMENTNIRGVTKETIGELCDFASIDVSFISLTKVIPHVLELLKSNGEVVALIKPQFEAGIGKVSKKGVVRNIKIHEEVILNVVTFLIESGLHIINLDYSPIKGPNGNIEYLIYFSKDNNLMENFDVRQISYIISRSHAELDREGI